MYNLIARKFELPNAAKNIPVKMLDQRYDSYDVYQLAFVYLFFLILIITTCSFEIVLGIVRNYT